MSSLQTQLISPRQASDIYSQNGKYPKQRNTFLVRFNKSSGLSTTTALITYAVKLIDRPSIQPIVEELNQYNKKRQIYTGYKKSNIKCAFYDDAVGSALKMWNEYSKYYFGDFSVGASATSYHDDIVSDYLDTGTGFGFTAKNGGNSNPNSQWFFRNIEIIHFHNKTYDVYTLVNPKISSFSPDELDFEQSSISMINCEFAYEAVIFTPDAGDASQIEQIMKGGLLNGRVEGTTADNLLSTTTHAASFGDSSQLTDADLGSLFSSSDNINNTRNYPNYRYYSNNSDGGLGIFGSFVFGAINGAVNSAINPKLHSIASQNKPVGSALQIGGYVGNPLALASSLGLYNNSAKGVHPRYSGIQSNVLKNTKSDFGNIVDKITQSVLVADLITGQNNQNNLNGYSLTPNAFGVINAQRPGSAQYGFNYGTSAAGSLYGYQGPSGVDVPSSLGNSPQPVQNYGGPIQAQPSNNVGDAITTPNSPLIDVTSTPLPPPTPLFVNPDSFINSDSSGDTFNSSVPPEPTTGVE